MKKRKLDKKELIERSIIKKFRKDIYGPFVKALDEYELIQDGDKIAVCISGGKDSFLLAKCMQEIQKHGNKKIELVFILMNPGFHDNIRQQIFANAKLLGIDLIEFKNKIFKIAEMQVKGGCYLCAKMRRGALYEKAESLGANKIALGHHFSDVIETILLNVFYGSEFKTMMPKLKSTNFTGMELIRPLYLIHEKDIISWVKYNELKFIKCACPVSDYLSKEEKDIDVDSKREEIKALIKKLQKDNPVVEKSIFNSASNINLDANIAWKKDGKKHNFLDEY